MSRKSNSELPNISHQIDAGYKLVYENRNGVQVPVLVPCKETKPQKGKKVTKVDGFHLIDLFEYVYKNKEGLLDNVNGMALNCSISCGYMQHLNSLNGNKMETVFRSILKEEGIVFLEEPLELAKYKKFDHFIEFNGEYYCIEQKQKDNHDHRKDVGEFSAIKNFPNEYNGKKVNKFIWFVSVDKGKTSKNTDINVLRGDEVFQLFFSDKEKCASLYNKLLTKIPKKDISSVYDLDLNYKGKVDFLFKHSGKNAKYYKKYINNQDFMTCLKALSKKNKFYNEFVEACDKYCGE